MRYYVARLYTVNCIDYICVFTYCVCGFVYLLPACLITENDELKSCWNQPVPLKSEQNMSHRYRGRLLVSYINENVRVVPGGEITNTKGGE